MIQFRAPSLTKPWDEFVSIDPVFVQAPQPPDDDASPEVKAEHRKALAEYGAKLRSARDTGDWLPLVAPDRRIDDATKFVLLQVDSNIWRELLDRATLPLDSAKRIGAATLRALLVRLAVKSIPGFPIAIERTLDEQWGYVMAGAEVVDLLDKHDARIVGELGTRIMERLRGVGPLS
jgi:hypothetical protein